MSGQMTKLIQQAIRESELPLARIAWLAGIDHGQLSRFMREERQLTLPVVEQICDVLGLELRRKPPPKRTRTEERTMGDIQRADELLQDEETAIAILTSGANLNLAGGTSCCWIVDAARIEHAKTVIIYHRPAGTFQAEIYRANFERAIRSPEEPNRHVIHFSDAEHVGSTQVNWKDFAETGQNPIRYFNG